ncbi:MAG: DUF397 domain-containing protein [Parcubacteria group bacterium]|jgi:hypothetical protein|nr:DUF397 domain-containing protein [Parcubacteria group bacterium]
MSKNVQNIEGLNFRKSSYSQYTHNRCVEVAFKDEMVFVRDSKNPEGSVLCFSRGEWQAFSKGVKDNEFEMS